MTAAIVVKQLSKSYSAPKGPVTALADVEFNVEQGEFLCIVGPSGCGKTTLLRTLIGLEAPSAGSVTFRAPTGGAAPTTAMVFQEHGLFPWLSLRDNVAFPLRNYHSLSRAAAARSAAEWLERVGLEAFADFYPRQVSGGMRQRTALARSFAVEPELLFMDEPFVFLDYQTRLALHVLLLELWRQRQSTVVFVTHDIEEAVTLADRILVFSTHPGRIIRELRVPLARPRDVYAVRDAQPFWELTRELTGLLRAQAGAGDLRSAS